MSQSVLEKHRNLRATLDPERTLTDGANIWTESFCEVYDELSDWNRIVDANHGVRLLWGEFCGADPDVITPERVTFFLAWLVRRAHTLVPPDNPGN